MIKQTYGMMIFHAENCNMNGDPDNQGYPRITQGHAMVSPVSVKRKLRDLIADKNGYVWTQIVKAKFPDIDENKFKIYSTDSTKATEFLTSQNLDEYWDGRLFGHTLLKDKSTYLNSGALQFSMGKSVNIVNYPVTYSITSKINLDEKKDHGMAPSGLKYIPFALYTIKYNLNPNAAIHNNLTDLDWDVFRTIAPYVYMTTSLTRPLVYMSHIWNWEVKTPATPPKNVYDSFESLMPTTTREDGRMDNISECVIPNSEAFMTCCGDTYDIEDLMG